MSYETTQKVKFTLDFFLCLSYNDLKVRGCEMQLRTINKIIKTVNKHFEMQAGKDYFYIVYDNDGAYETFSIYGNIRRWTEDMIRAEATEFDHQINS